MRTWEQKWLARSEPDFADALERDAHAVVADRHIEVDFNSEPLQIPVMDR